MARREEKTQEWVVFQKASRDLISGRKECSEVCRAAAPAADDQVMGGAEK